MPSTSPCGNCAGSGLFACNKACARQQLLVVDACVLHTTTAVPCSTCKMVLLGHIELQCAGRLQDAHHAGTALGALYVGGILTQHTLAPQEHRRACYAPHVCVPAAKLLKLLNSTRLWCARNDSAQKFGSW